MSEKLLLSDADKLLAVCRVVWPDGDYSIANAGLPDQFVMVERGARKGPGRNDGIYPTSLDDLRRVLLALTPEQLEAVNKNLAVEVIEHEMFNPPSHYFRPMEAHEALTAPTSTILDALHRAVCAEGQEQK